MWRSLRWYATAISTCLLVVLPIVWVAPPPDFKAQEAHYYAVLTPTEIKPFDYAYYSAQESKPFLVKHPEIAEEIVLRAFLKGAIFFAEGVYPNQYDWSPYDIIVGYFPLDDHVAAEQKYADHPRLLINLTRQRPAQAGDNCGLDPGDDLCSDAAGACQAISTTWDLRHREYPTVWFEELPAFHGRNQDLFCAVNFWATGGYKALMQGISVDETTSKIQMDVDAFSRAVFESCDEWASFPNAQGRSCLNQGTKPIESIWQNFQKVLEEEQALFLPVASAAPAPAEKPLISDGGSNPEDMFPDEMKLPPKDGETIGGYIVTDVRRFRENNPVTGAPGYNRWHDGFDFGIDVGVPLYAPMPGKAVCHLGDNSGFGNYVEFFPAGLDGRSFVFKHLNDCVDMVWDGTAEVVPLFGHTGNTGFGSGPHLHMAGWRYVGDTWEHYDYAKGWTVGFLTGKLPQKG